MILWSELEQLFEESIKKDQNLEIQLLFNKCSDNRSKFDNSYFR